MERYLKRSDPNDLDIDEVSSDSEENTCRPSTSKRSHVCLLLLFLSVPIINLHDEKFVKSKERQKKTQTQLQTYKFRSPSILAQPRGFQKNNLPIAFQVTPDTLLNLAARVVDALPLPNIYDWTNVDVCRWIRQYGYPQYQHTFRVNHITGRKLLLVDAQTLSAMNIRDFAQIKHIAYGIRQLFYFEMTKVMRSISLPPEYYYEIYKLFKVSTGPQHEATRRTDLWRRVQLLRAKSKLSSHWDLLERWLARRHDPVELIGGKARRKLYHCKIEKPSAVGLSTNVPCTCSPPCSCHWTELHIREPTMLTVLAKHRKPEAIIQSGSCVTCLPPCSCTWPSKFYNFNEILSCLKQSFPIKYDEKRNVRTFGYYEGSYYSTTSYASTIREAVSDIGSWM